MWANRKKGVVYIPTAVNIDGVERTHAPCHTSKLMSTCSRSLPSRSALLYTRPMQHRSSLTQQQTAVNLIGPAICSPQNAGCYTLTTYVRITPVPTSSTDIFLWQYNTSQDRGIRGINSVEESSNTCCTVKQKDFYKPGLSQLRESVNAAAYQKARGAEISN
jgi:hypothetical protein